MRKLRQANREGRQPMEKEDGIEKSKIINRFILKLLFNTKS